MIVNPFLLGKKGGKIEDMDKISELPDFILHQILSLLPRKNAAKTCVLSKRWSSIWDSFPIFEFNQSVYIKGSPSSRPEYMEKFGEFKNVVDKALEKFSQKKLLMESFCFSMLFMNHNLVSMIEGWMLLALNNGVQEISLRVATDLKGFPENFYTFPETLFAVESVTGCSTFNRLQKLSLEWVCISNDVIRDIIRRCPNINYFSLTEFYGLKTLEISKLDKLESVSIVNPAYEGELGSISIDAPSLKYFTFKSHAHSTFPCKISLTSCHDLKDLCLHMSCLTDDLLNFYLSRFLFLENLEIYGSPLLHKVRISSQQLKGICLLRCDKIEMIQIDAPSLSSVKFKTCVIPDLVLENVTCPMEIEYEFKRGGKVDSSWFLKMRKFLGLLPQKRYFTVHCTENEVCFDIEELGQGEIPPVIKIDHLEISSFVIEKQLDCATLIDGLLWSCHPMIISVPPGSMFRNNCIKVLCEKLLDNDHQPSCCNSSHIKCWRHDLKAAKIESFGGIVDERLLYPNLLFDTILPSLRRSEKVRFNLEWAF